MTMEDYFANIAQERLSDMIVKEFYKAYHNSFSFMDVDNIIKKGEKKMTNTNGEWTAMGSASIASGDMTFSMKTVRKEPYPERVLFNDRATILFWSDGEKTVSVCQDGDEYSQETGVLNCIAQRYVKQLNKKVGRLIDKAVTRV